MTNEESSGEKHLGKKYALKNDNIISGSIKLLIIVFTAELGIMFVFKYFNLASGMPDTVINFLDAFLLSFIIAPVVYFIIIVPIQRNYAKNTLIIKEALALKDRITEGINEWILLLDKESRILWANKKALRAYGNGIIGKYCYDVVHHLDGDSPEQKKLCPVQQIIDTGIQTTLTHTHYDKDGTMLYFEVNVYPVRDEKNKVINFVHVSRDITEKVRLEETIRNIIDPLIVIGANRNISSVNIEAETLLGYSKDELVGNPASRIITEKVIDDLFKKESISNSEITCTTRNKEEIPVSFSGSVMKDKNGGFIGAVYVIRDMRKLRKLQSELFQSEKMASVGRLAGGVAHEINNPLTVILGYSQNGIKNLKEDNPMYKPLKSIEEASKRCKRIIDDLLAFSRAEKSEKEEVDINEAIEQALSLVNALSKTKNIQIIRNYGEGLPRLTVNKNRIQQVIVNLCNNAMDAMPKGGSITVRTKISGESIEIEISDTGEGMSEEVKKHLFEPFFTTKEVGKGTGLGLSLCHGIVTKSGGSIKIDSEKGKGTTITVSLPLKTPFGA